MDTRTETDSFGTIEVPAEALWGAQTERSRRFFAIGAQRMPLARYTWPRVTRTRRSDRCGGRGRPGVIWMPPIRRRGYGR